MQVWNTLHLANKDIADKTAPPHSTGSAMISRARRGRVAHLFSLLNRRRQNAQFLQIVARPNGQKSP
jgi:hypothetical protein